MALVINLLPRKLAGGLEPLTIYEDADNWVPCDVQPLQAGTTFQYIRFPKNTASVWSDCYITDTANQIDINVNGGYVVYQGITYYMTKSNDHSYFIKLPEPITLSNGVSIGMSAAQNIIALSQNYMDTDMVKETSWSGTEPTPGTLVNIGVGQTVKYAVFVGTGGYSDVKPADDNNKYFNFSISAWDGYPHFIFGSFSKIGSGTLVGTMITLPENWTVPNGTEVQFDVNTNIKWYV